MLNYSELGAQIRSQRKQKGLSQAIVAHIVGISTSYYGHIERGTRVATLDTFVKIMDILDMSADRVLQIRRT